MHLIHRGIVSKKYHENLLKSFEQSFKKGFGIETDIHATKDNEFICFHDFTLTRIYKRKESVKKEYINKSPNKTFEVIGRFKVYTFIYDHKLL